MRNTWNIEKFYGVWGKIAETRASRGFQPTPQKIVKRVFYRGVTESGLVCCSLHK